MGTEVALRHDLDMMVRFVSSRKHVSRARMATFDVVAVAWDLGDLADDAELVASELLSNALRKSRQPPILTVTRDGKSVIVAVWDDSPEKPDLKNPDQFDEAGRGLHIVAALSAERGCYAADSGGKVVWARLKI